MLNRIQEIREAARNGQHLSIEDIYFLEQILTYKEKEIEQLLNCLQMLLKEAGNTYEMT